MPLEYDPTEYGSMEEAAKSRAAMEQEFGKPSKPHADTPFGRRVNELHYQQERDMNNDLGWHGQTDAGLRKKWGL